MKRTKQHEKYWRDRRIDWKQSYFDTFNHPHRDLILNEIRKIRPGSLLEVGCASGPNLYRIRKEFPWIELGGIDVNKEALEEAKKLIPPPLSYMQQGQAWDLFLSDKSVDVILTDMTLIYVGRDKIKKVIQELKRVARNKIMLIEFHHPSFWKRLKLKINSDYNCYNWRKELEEDFYNIEITKLTEEDWPGGQPQKEYACLITANL